MSFGTNKAPLEVTKETAFGWTYFRALLFILMVTFNGVLDIDDERQIARWKGIVSAFKGKLVKTIKNVNGRFDDYSISAKIRQILLHWGFELVENDLLWFIFCSYKNEILFF